MKNKWIPFSILFTLSILCSLAAGICAVGAYLANTGLDLLVMSKYTLPKWALGLGIGAGVLWIITLALLFIMKPYKKESVNNYY